MYILLWPLLGVLLIAFFYKTDSTTGFISNIRESFIKSLLAAGFMLYVCTEVLSQFNALHTEGITSFWGVIVLVFGSLCVGKYKHLFGRNPNTQTKYSPRHLVHQIKGLFSLPGLKFWTVIVGSLYLIPLLFLAVYSPPNNTDSVNYHLARVVFWLQNQNVEHFPTMYVQQLYHNVFSEYILLHVMVLSGWEDYYVNLVQYFAMTGAVASISLVAKQLGFGWRSQLLVGVLQLTVPIGILESTTTQNDYVTNFLFIVFLYYGLEAILKMRHDHAIPSKAKAAFFDNIKTIEGWVWMAVALALCGFAKYTGLMFAFPICIWIAVESLRKQTFVKSLQLFLIIASVLSIVFFPFFKRNYDFFGHIIGAFPGSPLFTEIIANERSSAATIISGVIKNMALHVGLPHQGFNHQIDRIIIAIHQWIEVPLDDPQLIFDKYYTRFIIQEDMSSNPWHFFLIMGALVWFYVSYRKYRQSALRYPSSANIAQLLLELSICALVGFVLYCSLIKFQFYNARTQLPFFSIGYLWTAFVLRNISPKINSAIILTFLLLGLPYVFVNYNKTLIPMRQIVKQVMGYEPKYLCIKSKGKLAEYKKKLSEIYDFEKGRPCFPLRRALTYSERIKLISKLRELGYYETDQRTVFSQSRLQNYFVELYDLSLYTDLQLLASRLDKDTRGVAVLQGNVLGFYREWLIFKTHLRRPVPMQYIAYHEKYLDAPNTSRLFTYDYVLVNHTGLIDKYINREEIEEITPTENYLLVKLKHPSTRQFPYPSYAEVLPYETRQ